MTHSPLILMNSFQYGFICRAKRHLQWRISLSLPFPVSLLSIFIWSFSDHLTPSHTLSLSWTKNKAFGLPVSRSLKKYIWRIQAMYAFFFLMSISKSNTIQKSINSFALMPTHFVSSPGISTLDSTRAENP